MKYSYYLILSYLKGFSKDAYHHQLGLALQEMTQQVLHLVAPHPAARLQDLGLIFLPDLHPSHPTCISENQASL